ncbi:hypothetical protein CPE01_01760 [Cellulomonas persica]|uniref:Thioesterase domain-containing protein n=1 Tax=Cellulomonas persica TaxID=76861 RepID=A0A510UP54_9CELL|nr:hypothetical protein CPE01_01760 [Cellulomonas persica]
MLAHVPGAQLGLELDFHAPILPIPTDNSPATRLLLGREVAYREQPWGRASRWRQAGQARSATVDAVTGEGSDVVPVR